MAEAKQNTREVVDSITLELTHQEAVALLVILGSVGGNQRQSARKYTDSVYDVLAPITPGKLDADTALKLLHGSMYLKDGSYHNIEEAVAQSSP